MASIEKLLETISLDDLATLATIKSVGMVDGKRDVDLNDPLVYTTVEVEPAPLPEGTKLETRGRGQNVVDVLVSDQVTDNPFSRFIGGLADALTLGTFDFDKRGDWHGSDYEHKAGLRGGSGYGKVWDQEKENRLAEQKKRADLGGDALPSPKQTRKNLVSQAIRDNYAIDRLKELNDYELERWKNAYPQYTKIINDEIYRRTMQALYTRPDLLQQRMEKARDNYVGALLNRSQAQTNIANATAMGLGRYSGIRNVAG